MIMIDVTEYKQILNQRDETIIQQADEIAELLEACEMVMVAAGESNSVRRTILEMHAWKAVSAAIAKAKGETDD